MKKYLVALMISFAIALPVMGSVASAEFDPVGPACKATEAVVGNTGDAKAICDESEKPTDRVSGDGSIIATAANVLAVIAGIVAVVIIIFSGIKLMTSNGDSAKFASSRNAIIYTVVGLFVVLLSRTIVVFIISRIST